MNSKQTKRKRRCFLCNKSAGVGAGANNYRIRRSLGPKRPCDARRVIPMGSASRAMPRTGCQHGRRLIANPRLVYLMNDTSVISLVLRPPSKGKIQKMADRPSHIPVTSATAQLPCLCQCHHPCCLQQTDSSRIDNLGASVFWWIRIPEATRKPKATTSTEKETVPESGVDT